MDPSPAAGGPSGSVSPAVCLPSPGSHEPPRSLPEEPERLGAQGVRTRLCQGLRRVSSAAPRKAPDVRQAATPRSALPGSATVASAHGRDNRGPGPLGHRTSGLAKGNPCRLFANVSLCRPVLGGKPGCGMRSVVVTCASPRAEPPSGRCSDALRGDRRLRPEC